jgi:Bacterial SH3 domain
VQKILLVLFVVCSFTVKAQTVYYAAAKTGLSLREQPNATAKVLEKIAYAEKVITIADSVQPKTITTEGFNGYWWKVKYNNKEGYLVSTYLLPVPPPKAGIKKLEDYFAQVSTAAGSPVVLQKTDAASNEMGESNLTKQFYKNGMEWHKSQGYETGSEVFMLPDFSIEQCFLLLRLVGQYPDCITEKDGFPVKNAVIKNDNGEKGIDIEREKYDGPQGPAGKPGPVKKIKITLAQGAYTELEIFMLDTQGVIYWNSGV